MTRRALAIGCGGTLGLAWGVVALRSIETALGWDAREADVLLGTSMGAEVVAALGAGHSARDLLDALEDQPAADPRLQRHLDTHPGKVPPVPRPTWPALGLVPAGIRRRSAHTALAGLLPGGRGDASWLRQFGRDLAGDGWVDHPATWIAAADAATGERAIFGTPGAPEVDLGTAIAASWAIPGWFPPVEIAGRRYVDGGAVSSVSADALLGFRRAQPPAEQARPPIDEVIVLAPMTSDGGAPARGAERFERLLRSAMTCGLDREIAQLRAAGVRVLRVEPTDSELAAMGPNFMDIGRRPATVEAARQAAGTRMAAVKAAMAGERV